MCEKQVAAGYRRTIEGAKVPLTVKCGSFWPSGYGGVRAVLCIECEEQAREQYSQGWLYGPGDTCRHGRYHDPAGRDCACPCCEQ